MLISSSRTIRRRAWANRPFRRWRPHWATPSLPPPASGCGACRYPIWATRWRSDRSAFLHGPGASPTGSGPLARRAVFGDRAGIDLLAFAGLTCTRTVANEADFSVLHLALNDRVGSRSGATGPSRRAGKRRAVAGEGERRLVATGIDVVASADETRTVCRRQLPRRDHRDLALLQFSEPRPRHAAIGGQPGLATELSQHGYAGGGLRHRPGPPCFVRGGRGHGRRWCRCRRRRRRSWSSGGCTSGGLAREIKTACYRRIRHPGLLRSGRRLLYREAYGVEGLENILTGFADRFRQRPGVGAVAVRSVTRHAVGLRRVGNQGAFGRLYLRQPAHASAQAAAAEWIVAAGVEDHDVELGAGAFHLAQH